ncbi:hypothetical protein EZY14_017390 [Kordia sp. TARA_039_SRF]|nr:hypothetical protein EZY14_017390 [Kordia sp. TARA_039_SRF]
MIIWTGRGILVALILVIIFIFIAKTFDLRFEETLSIAAITTSPFCFLFGWQWNTKVIEKNTKRIVRQKNRHTIFWIPIQYWGIILLTIGTIFLLQDDTALFVLPLLGLGGIIAMAFVPWTLEK